MELYEYNDYKAALQAQVKNLRTQGKPVTLKKIAQKVGIQYTYLSRSLNQDGVHLGEEHLFSICKLLLFFPEEIDYIFHLRSLAMATQSSRRDFLVDKIDRIRRAKQLRATVQEVNSRQLSQEMAYLFDPICQVVLVALSVPEFLESPEKISASLGISAEHLRRAIRTLSDLGFIELDPESKRIRKILKMRFHYGTDHPLMRTHQAMLRTLIGTRLAQTPEENKQSFMTTFSADRDTLDAIRGRFQAFIREAEQMVMRAKPKMVCQLSFDLFQWL